MIEGGEGGGDSDGHDSNDGGDVVPQDPTGYQLPDPEDFELDDADRELQESFKQKAHALRLTPAQAAGLRGWQIDNVKLIRDAEQAAYERAASTARTTLEKEWGQDFKTRLEGAKGVMKAEGLDKFANAYLKDGRRVGDTLEFVRTMAKLHNAAAAGSSRSASHAGASRNAASAEAAKEQIAAITEAAVEKGLNPTSKTWPHEKLDKLYKTAHGGGSLNTSYGSDVNAQGRK